MQNRVAIQSSSKKCSEFGRIFGTLFQNTFREDPDSIKIENLPENCSENPSEKLNQNVTCINCFLRSSIFGFGESFGKDFRKNFRKLMETGPGCS